MEQWEAIIENLERLPDQCHRTFEKTLETAAALLNNAAIQLAPFETEWLVETLLHLPVNVLARVSQRRGDEVWRKAVADALKLLAQVAGLCHKHYEEIVDICLLNYDPELRKYALGCLAEVAKHSDAATRDIARHVQALEEATQCRAPIALLVGALCEHHPAVVCEELTRIWRGYLNMLDNTKNTDTVTKAALEGVRSLFKHFGDELPCAEINHFYDNLANGYIDKPGCQAACYSILAEHASLFRERVSKDRALRVKLWGAAPSATLLSVYAACVDRTALVNILTTEVLPHTQSVSHQVKLTALRVLAASKVDGFGDLSQYADVHTLEYEMRRKVSHADAELILWCVEYNLPNSERLLQAAILFYDNLPLTLRRKIVVKGILNSPPELKRAAIQFLISESCGDPSVRVWRDLLEDDDVPVVSAIVRELADCLTVALDAVADDDELEELPPKLSSLLRLASLVPAARACPLRACGVRLRGLAHAAAALSAAGPLLAGACGTDDFYKSIRLHRCRDETTLHAACLALAQSPQDVHVDPSEMVTALQIIFSSDVEPKIHIEALSKFDYLINNEKTIDFDIRDAIRSIEKLRTRGDRTDRDVRILHREITIFLGKHGNVDMNNNRDSWDDGVVVDLKRSLALTVPFQGTSYKVDLKTTLLLALQHDDPSALLTLLAMLCTNLSSNKELATQRAIIRVVLALANAHANGGGEYAAHIQQAVRLCGDAGVDLMQYIGNSKSCGARKLLATALATLCEEPDALQRVVERASVMLASNESTTKRAGLDIAETVLTSLENNHALSKTTLPELTTLIAKTHDSDTKNIFNMASKAFIDKKQLFDQETIKKTVLILLDNILKNNLSDVKIYKDIVKMTVEFIKNLRDVKLDELLDAVFDICKNDVNVKTLYVLAVMKNEFDFDSDMLRRIVGRENCALLNCLLGVRFDENELFKVEVVFKFLEEYCEVILELKYKELIQLISDLITNFTPSLIKEMRKNIKLCFDSLKKHWKRTPKTIITSVQTWLNTLPIKKITAAIERELFTNEHHLYIQAFNIMSNIFDITDIILPDVKHMSNWPKFLMKLYTSGRLEEYFYEEIPYFNDMLTVSLKFLATDDLNKILKCCGYSKNISFCGFFIEGFFDALTKKPYILLDDELKECSVVLNDVVRMAAKKNMRERYENVLELVDKLWPTYEQQATFVQKHCLLGNLQCLNPRSDSNPLQWAKRVVCSLDATLDQRTKLLCFLPDETFKLPEVSAAVSSLFPARLRELRPALLEAAAEHPAALLPTIAALANNDTSTGWWDAALESCVASAAKRNHVDICGTLYHKCHGERACERVLVPLLRHSSTEICERFLASVLARVLGDLNKGPRGAPAHPAYTRRWEEYLISLYLLLVAFEKLPTSSLESPASVLYSLTSGPTPWHVVRETCKLCHRLRDTLYCPARDHQLYPMYRKLQCQIYNVMCAAICRRRPAAPLYETLVSTEALSKIVDDTEEYVLPIRTSWEGEPSVLVHYSVTLVSTEALSKIVDDTEEYVLPIRTSWSQRTKALPVAVPLESTSSLSPSHTQRTRIFLRTLSENPMLFDLHSADQEMMEVQDISLVETPLNSHPSAATLTALLRHAAAVPTLACVWRALACLLHDAGTNLKWLLAQVICNCKEELRPQASALLPGLLAVLASVENGKSMNGLHLDVLETVLYWKEDITSDDLNIITHHLITTCMENRRKNVFDGLLKTLYGFLELYDAIQVEWRSFEQYYEDKHQDTQKALFQLIKTISKSKYIPQILPKIVAKLDTDPSKVAECFGLAMAACDVAGEKGPALGEFRRYLERSSVITNYVRVLYYASWGSAECCGEQEFRKIADYVTKVTSGDRTKCLQILSSYLSRGRRSEYVHDMFDTIDMSNMIDKDHKALLLVKNGLPLMDEAMKRRCVAQVAALKPAAAKDRKLVVEVTQRAYEELFASPPQPPAKRQKTESTPILSICRDDVYSNSILTSLGVYAVDSDMDVSAAAREALMVNLDKDLGARFAECFLLTIYLPAHTDKPADVCVCVSALLDMLFGGIRLAEVFKELRLRDEPLPVREEPESRLLTLSKSFQGTFGSYSATRRRTRARASTSTTGSEANKSAIDVQMPIDSILQTLLDFAKSTPEAARSLLTEVLRSILSSTKFDVTSALVPLLGTLLGRVPTELTPVYIDVCRVLEGRIGVLAPVQRLRGLTAGSEGAALTQLLYEEVAMRCLGDAMFQLGQPEGVQDVAMNEVSTFSIEDLKLAFGKLSNWDDLTLQQQRTVKNSLPPLWTDRRDFVTRLDSYQVASADSWFDKMAAAFKQQSVDSWRWLRKADQWPRRHFEISAVTEAMLWRRDASETAPAQLFKSSECLADWAARLMIRSSYYNSLQHSATDDKMRRLSLSHELKWCMRANEMGIPNVALQCVERNVEELNREDTLVWLQQKLLALRQVARERENTELLGDALKKAEKYTPQFSKDHPSVCIEMYHLMLLLHKDLKSLQHHNLQSILATVERSASQVDWKTCSKEAVSSVYEIAISLYEEAMDAGTTDEESALSNMSVVVSRAAAYDTSNTELLLAVLLNRLNKFQSQLEVETTRDLLEKLAPVLPNLDAFSLELLEKNAYKFPAELQRTLAAMLPKDASVEKYRRCLQLVCDPGHLLTHYCEELVMASRDEDPVRWKSTHDRMRDKIFDNPYAGPSFKLLDKYKEDLYQMYHFEPTSGFTSSAESKLKSIVLSVRRDPQSTLRLSDLCPALLGPMDDTGVEKWFGLRGVKVVKLYDKVQVFTDSIRRPVVVTMLVSCGRTRRVIQKTGEPLARDAAAQRVAAVMRHNVAYSVTLLDEEGALIEFLEGHERLRTMIGSSCNLDVLHTVSRPADDLLVQSPAASLQAHVQLCAKVPANALRSAMEQSSSCVQDFIWKKRNFTDSLADMTLLTWLLGLGDRHLQNIMCSRGGVVRSVDWGDVWRRTELPARLTRNLLAVADIQVLEARLQTSLAAARGCALLEAAVRAAFHWLPALEDQMQHVRGILLGVTSSYDVCRDVTSRSQLGYKDQYLRLLDRTLGDSHKYQYSVDEQVTSLLRHCTSPELLSVVRAGWEPWL